MCCIIGYDDYLYQCIICRFLQPVGRGVRNLDTALQPGPLSHLHQEGAGLHIPGILHHLVIYTIVFYCTFISLQNSTK